MKGLRKYIKKHGRHFTEELAMTITCGKWNPTEIMEKAESMVYYNVTGSTIGDIVFLTNYAGNEGNPFHRTKHNCIRHALHIIEDYTFREGAIFSMWIKETNDFDFTPYI